MIAFLMLWSMQAYAGDYTFKAPYSSDYTTPNFFDDLPPTAPLPDPSFDYSAPDDDTAPTTPGASRDSNGREYVIRIERRVVRGIVVWRVWQQYLDLPESTAWANWEPPLPKKRRH